MSYICEGRDTCLRECYKKEPYALRKGDDDPGSCYHGEHRNHGDTETFFRECHPYLRIGDKEVDLRECNPGDRLLSKHGMILRYVRPLPEGSFYDHEVLYPDGSYGTRVHSGHVAKDGSKRLHIDHDIVMKIEEDI